MTTLSTTNRDAIVAVLGEYGYTLNQANYIEQLPKYGTHQSNLQVTEKRGRFHVRIGTPDGALLFSTPHPGGLGDFLKQRWYRNKVTCPHCAMVTSSARILGVITMNKLITLDLLKAKCACKTQRDLFERIAGSSIVLTKQWCLDNAQHFQWDWAAQYLLPDAALAEYRRVADAAQAEYGRVTAPAWTEYERVRNAALAEYNRVEAPAWTEYNRVEAPALAEYWRVQYAAWAEYNRVEAPAWTEYRRVRDAARAELERVQAVAFFNLYDFDKVPE